MLATGFSFSLVLLFFIFSPFSLARMHSLCLIITFHDWLQHATCCPADSISFLTRCICWSRRGWHWGWKCQRDCQCLKTTAAHQKKRALPWKQTPQNSRYPQQEWCLYPGRKRSFHSNISSSPGDLGMGGGIAVGKKDYWVLTLLISQKYYPPGLCLNQNTENQTSFSRKL